MSTVQAIFNVVLVIMIVSTMFPAGLGITLDQLVMTFRRIGLVVLVLLANLVVVPLLGWGFAALFSLTTSAYIALVLVASSPGGPFGAKLAMIQRGDVVAGASMQVLLAAIGSVTFAPTANWILTAAKVGGGVSLPVGNLIKTVVFLQVVPFLIGLAIRHWAPETAEEWRPFSQKISSLTLLLVVAGALLGSWHQIVALFGSRTLLAGVLFTVAAMVAGGLLATGTRETRTTLALVAPLRNAGPVFAAVGIAFKNNPAILGAVTAIIVVQLVIAVPVAAYLGKSRQPAKAPAPPATTAAAASSSTPPAAVRDR